jgi:hypothetical protein
MKRQVTILQASEMVVFWAKQSYDHISTADDEMADMKRVGLLGDMGVDLIDIELLGDMWKVHLSIVGGWFDVVVSGLVVLVRVFNKRGCSDEESK